ncbi:PsbP-related protein [Gloeocapsa sp. BRSZ]
MKLKLILLALAAIAGLGDIFFQTITNNKPLPEQISQINPQWQTYVEPNTYSIQHPPNWFVERLRRELVIISSLAPVTNGTGKFPPDLIKTDIRVEPSSFESLANQILNSEVEISQIIRKEQPQIDGREALTLWISDRFGANSVLTIVRYQPHETIYIASFHTTENTAAPNIIQNIHGSLRISE